MRVVTVILECVCVFASAVISLKTGTLAGETISEEPHRAKDTGDGEAGDSVDVGQLLFPDSQISSLKEYRYLTAGNSKHEDANSQENTHSMPSEAFEGSTWGTKSSGRRVNSRGMWANKPSWGSEGAVSPTDDTVGSVVYVSDYYSRSSTRRNRMHWRKGKQKRTETVRTINSNSVAKTSTKNTRLVEITVTPISSHATFTPSSPLPSTAPPSDETSGATSSIASIATVATSFSNPSNLTHTPFPPVHHFPPVRRRTAPGSLGSQAFAAAPVHVPEWPWRHFQSSSDSAAIWTVATLKHSSIVPDKIIRRKMNGRTTHEMSKFSQEAVVNNEIFMEMNGVKNIELEEVHTSERNPPESKKGKSTKNIFRGKSTGISEVEKVQTTGKGIIQKIGKNEEKSWGKADQSIVESPGGQGNTENGNMSAEIDVVVDRVQVHAVMEPQSTTQRCLITTIRPKNRIWHRPTPYKPPTGAKFSVCGYGATFYQYPRAQIPSRRIVGRKFKCSMTRGFLPKEMSIVTDGPLPLKNVNLSKSSGSSDGSGSKIGKESDSNNYPTRRVLPFRRSSVEEHVSSNRSTTSFGSTNTSGSTSNTKSKSLSTFNFWDTTCSPNSSSCLTTPEPTKRNNSTKKKTDTIKTTEHLTTEELKISTFTFTTECASSPTTVCKTTTTTECETTEECTSTTECDTTPPFTSSECSASTVVRRHATTPYPSTVSVRILPSRTSAPSTLHTTTFPPTTHPTIDTTIEATTESAMTTEFSTEEYTPEPDTTDTIPASTKHSKYSEMRAYNKNQRVDIIQTEFASTSEMSSPTTEMCSTTECNTKRTRMSCALSTRAIRSTQVVVAQVAAEQHLVGGQMRDLDQPAVIALGDERIYDEIYDSQRQNAAWRRKGGQNSKELTLGPATIGILITIAGDKGMRHIERTAGASSIGIPNSCRPSPEGTSICGLSIGNRDQEGADSTRPIVAISRNPELSADDKKSSTCKTAGNGLTVCIPDDSGAYTSSSDQTTTENLNTKSEKFESTNKGSFATGNTNAENIHIDDQSTFSNVSTSTKSSNTISTVSTSGHQTEGQNTGIISSGTVRTSGKNNKNTTYTVQMKIGVSNTFTPSSEKTNTVCQGEGCASTGAESGGQKTNIQNTGSENTERRSGIYNTRIFGNEAQNTIELRIAAYSTVGQDDFSTPHTDIKRTKRVGEMSFARPAVRGHGGHGSSKERSGPVAPEDPQSNAFETHRESLGEPAWGSANEEEQDPLKVHHYRCHQRPNGSIVCSNDDSTDEGDAIVTRRRHHRRHHRNEARARNRRHRYRADRHALEPAGTTAVDNAGSSPSAGAVAAVQSAAKRFVKFLGMEDWESVPLAPMRNNHPQVIQLLDSAKPTVPSFKNALHSIPEDKDKKSQDSVFSLWRANPYSPITEDVYATAKNTYTVEESNLKETLNTDLSGKGYSYDTLSAPTLGSLGKDTNTLMGIMAMLTMTAKPRSTREKSTLPPAELSKMNFGKDNTESRTYDDIDEDIANALARQRAASSVTMASTNENDDDSDLLSSSFGSIGDKVSKESRVTEENNEQANTKEDMNDLRTVKSSRGTKKMEADEESFTDSPVVELSERNTEYMNEWQMNRKLRTMSHISPKSYSVTDFRVTSQTTEETEAYSADHSTFSNSVTTNNDEDISEDDEVDSTSPIHTTARRATSRTLAHTDLIDTSPSEKVNRRSKTVSDIGASSTVYQISKELDSTDATSNDVSEKETILPSVAAQAKTTQSDSSNSVSLEKGKDITNAVVKDEINAYSESILYFNNEGELSISTPLISGSESLPRLTVFYSPTDNSVSKVDGAETDEVRRKPTTREALLQENRTHRRNEKLNKKHTKTFLKASVSQPQMYSITRDSLLLASRTNNLENESGTSGSMDSFTTENTWEKKKVSEPLDTKDISQSISLSDREGNIAETEDPKTYITVSNKGVKVRLGTDSVSGSDVTSMTNGKGLTSKGISDERTSSVSEGVKRKSSGDKERNNELINWDEFDLSDYISTDDKTSNIAPTPDGHQFHRELKKGPVNNKFRDSCTSTLDDEIKLEVVTNDGISDTFPTRHRAVKNTPDMSSTIPLCASASRLPSDELAAFVSSDATVKEIACDIKTLPASQETDQSIENASSEEYDAAVNAEKVARALEEAIGLATTSAVRWERCARKRRSVRDEDAVRLEVTVGAIDPWVRPSSQFPVPPLRLVPETLARRPLPPLSPLSPLPPAPLLPSVPHTNAWRLQGAQERPSQQFHGLRGEAAAQNDNAMLKQIPNPLPASILGSAKMHPDTLPLWKKAFEKTGGSSRLRLNPNPSGESWEQPKASKVPSVERTDPATVSLPAVGDVPLDGVLISKPPNWRQAATHHSSFNSIRDSARGFVYQPAGLPSGGLLKRPLHSNYEWQNPVSYVASTEGRTRNEWGMKVSDVQANSAPTLTQYLPITVMYQRDGDNELTLDPVEAQAMANDLTSAKAEQKMPDEEQTPYNVLMPLMSGPETLNDEHEMNMQEDGKKEEKIIAVGGKRSTCRRVSSHTEHMRLTGENIPGVEVGASRNAERPMSHGSLLISEADESTNADGESDDDEPQDTTVYNMPVSNERKVVEEYSMPELEVGNPKNSEYPESKFTVVETDRESTLKDIPVVEVHFPEKANLDSTAPVVRFEKKENHESKEKLGFERTTPQQQASERIQPIQSDLAKVEDDLMYTERSISQSTELLNKVNNVLPDIEINGAKISLRPIPPSKGCSNNDIALAAISQKDLRPPASSSHMEECNSPEICKGFCEGSFTNVKSTDDISGTSVLTSKKWDSKEHSSPTVALVMISYPTQTTPSAKHKTENKNTKACLPEDDENSATTEELCEPAVTESTIRTTKQTQRAKYTEPYKRTRTKRQTETSESCHSSVVCMIGSNKKHNESEGASTNFNQLSSNDTHSNIIISINVSLPVSESSSLKSSRTTKRFSRSSTVSAITTFTAAGNKMTQYAMEGHEPSFPIASKPPRTLVMGAKPQNKTAKVDNHLVISFGNEESAAAEFAVKQKKSTEENYKCVTIDPGPEILQNFQDAHGAVDDLQEKDHFQSHKIADAAASDSLDLLTTGQRMRVGPSANVNNLKFMSKDSVPRLSINIHRIDNIDGVESNAEKSDEVLRSQFDGEKMQTHEGDVMVDYEPLTRSEAPGNAVDSANEHGWIAKPQATPTGVIDDTQRKLVHLQLHRDSGGIEGMLEKGESRVEVNRRKPGHKSELVRLEHPGNDHRHRPHATYSVSADKEDTSSESSRHPAVLGGRTDHQIQLEGYRHSPESSNIARREHRDPESSAVLMLIPGDRSDSKIGPCSAEELTAHDKQDDTVGEVSGGPHYGTIAIRKPTVMRGSRRGFQSSTSDITGSDTTASGTTDSAKTVSGSTVSGSTVSGTSVSGTTGSDTTGSNLTSSDTTVSDITTSGTTAADTTASGTTATGTTASGTTATGTTASGTTASASTVSDTITPDTTTSESTVSGTTASDTTESGTAVSSTIAKLGRTSDFGKQSTFPTSSMRPLITDINVNAEISASAATTPASTSNSKTQISETSRATETSGLCSTQTSGGNSTKTSTTHSKKPSSSTRKYNTMATCTRKTLKMCTTPRTTRKRTTIKRTKPPKTCASPTIPIKKTKVTKLKCTKQTVTRNTTRSTKTTRYTTRKAITTRPPKTTRRCIAKLTKSTRCTKLKVTKCVTVRLAKPKPIRTTALRKCTTKSCITQKKAKKTTRKCVYVNTKPTCLTTRCKPKTTPCPVITTKKITTISPKQITTNCTRITPFITTLIFKRPEENELATGTEDQAEMALPELSASSSYHFNLDQMTSIEPSPTTLLVELVPDSETISSKHRTKKIVNTTPSGIVFALFPDTNTTPSALPTRYKENTEMSPIEPPLDISSEARSTQSLLHSTHIERNELLMGSSDMSLMFDLETSRMQIASTQFVQNALSTTMASLHMMPLPSRSDTLMASVQYSPNTSAYGVIPEQLQTNTQSMGLPATGFPASGQFAQLAVNNQTMSPIQLISNSEANTSSNEFAFQQISNIQSSSNNRSYEAAGVRNSLPNIPLQATSPNAGSVTYAGVESSPKAVKVQGINQLATGTSYSSSQMTAREPINVQPMATTPKEKLSVSTHMSENPNIPMISVFQTSTPNIPAENTVGLVTKNKIIESHILQDVRTIAPLSESRSMTGSQFTDSQNTLMMPSPKVSVPSQTVQISDLQMMINVRMHTAVTSDVPMSGHDPISTQILVSNQRSESGEIEHAHNNIIVSPTQHSTQEIEEQHSTPDSSSMASIQSSTAKLPVISNSVLMEKILNISTSETPRLVANVVENVIPALMLTSAIGGAPAFWHQASNPEMATQKVSSVVTKRISTMTISKQLGKSSTVPQILTKRVIQKLSRNTPVTKAKQTKESRMILIPKVTKQIQSGTFVKLEQLAEGRQIVSKITQKQMFNPQTTKQLFWSSTAKQIGLALGTILQGGSTKSTGMVGAANTSMQTGDNSKVLPKMTNLVNRGPSMIPTKPVGSPTFANLAPSVGQTGAQIQLVTTNLQQTSISTNEDKLALAKTRSTGALPWWKGESTTPNCNNETTATLTPPATVLTQCIHTTCPTRSTTLATPCPVINQTIPTRQCRLKSTCSTTKCRPKTTCRPRTTPCPIPNLLGDKSTAVAAACEWSKLLDLLDRLDEASAAQMRRTAMAQWDYETNMTDQTRCAEVEAAVEQARFQKGLVRAAREIMQALEEKGGTCGCPGGEEEHAVQEMREREAMRRLAAMAFAGTAALCDEKVRLLEAVVSDMEETYGGATVCSYTRRDRCDMRIDPDVARVMTISPDPAELTYYWRAWHDATGRRMRHLYPVFVRLMNEAAHLNEMPDASALWLAPYEEPRLKHHLKEQWQRVRPLYLELHAHVRRRLRARFGPDAVGARSPLPAQLLGPPPAQAWGRVLPLAAPFPRRAAPDVSSAMRKQGWTAERLFREADAYMVSLNLSSAPASLWLRSMFEQPSDRRVMCHASAWDFFDGADMRVKACASPTIEDLAVACHEMGHVQYFLQYAHQPMAFREAANPGFHEAVGDVIALAVTGEPHMRRLKMMPCQRPSASEGTGDNGGYERGGKKCRGMRERQLNALMADALERLPLMPVALALERWRWDAFMGNVRPRSYTLHWWRLMEKYAGMGPPVPRSEEDFDPGAKYHVAAGAPYIQYFVSGILQFQLFRSLCIKAGQFDPRLPARKPLHQCDLYGNSVVAESLKNMMRLGSSVPWPEALAEVTCGQERALDAQGFLDYFSPLFEWLRVENARTGEPLGWDSEYKMKVFSTSKRKRNQRSDEANLGDMIGEVDDGG